MQAFRNDCFLADVAKGLIRRRHEYDAAALGCGRVSILMTQEKRCLRLGGVVTVSLVIL
jgi:hypothetical protein